MGKGIQAVRVDLPVELHQYLVTVLTRYSKAGIDPEEGMILFHTWDFLTKRAQVIELQEVAPTPPAAPAATDDADGLGDR